ncbi:MAG TPA: ABC transporter substrate-binding protein [Candidatus Nanoarchaeia archaeon]|nr:ABC transporter substrate-binding protein [Candidatus Nanoarchaeia archaeon]
MVKIYKIGIGIITVLIVIIIAITLNKSNEVEEETISIGGVFHLSGEGAFWGTGELNGANLALEEINSQGGINGKKLVLIVEDSETNFVKTVNAIQKLVNTDNLQVIIGPTWFAQAASPLAEQLKVLMISPSGGVILEPSKYFFSLWPTEKQEVLPIIKHMKEHNVKKVVVIYSLNDWSESVKNNFLEEARKNGISIGESFPTDPDEDDFRTIITKIKKTNSDAIFAPFAFYPSQGAFNKQAKEFELNLQIYSPSGTENPMLLKAFPGIEGTIYGYPQIDEQEAEFRKKYTAKFSIEASPPASYGYDALQLIASALREGKTTPEEIAQYLSSIKEYDGISNTISFDSKGRVTDKGYVPKTVENGKFIRITE